MPSEWEDRVIAERKLWDLMKWEYFALAEKKNQNQRHRVRP